jgi:hypothetical protein
MVVRAVPARSLWLRTAGLRHIRHSAENALRAGVPPDTGVFPGRVPCTVEGSGLLKPSRWCESGHLSPRSPSAFDSQQILPLPHLR